MEIVHEEWRPVKGREGQNEVSNLGRVRSRRKILKPLPHTSGYRCVSLDGRRARTIHSIVAEAFIGPRPDGMEVNHIDGDKTNNAVSNLEYVTRKRNMAHARETGLWDNRGELNGRATATNAQVEEAHRLVAGGMTHKQAAEVVGIPTHVVSAAATGRHWGLEPIPKRRSIRWTNEQIEQCVQLRLSGCTIAEISRRTGVPDETVRRHCVKQCTSAGAA
jgi:hypothetical protein